MGLHRRDIGTKRLTWKELSLFIRHLGAGSCFYRARFPKSSQWDTNTEFLSAILNVLQWANWQRGGGDGDKPEFIARPTDVEEPDVKPEEIQSRKSAYEAEIKRRQQSRQGKTRPVMEVNIG